mgnify:CR=1 FL=1
MNKERLNIFILIDALGWELAKDSGFLQQICPVRMPVKSILGFSSGVIPSILTGRYPKEHKHWSLYYYSPATSPFSWTPSLSWLPAGILRSRLYRKLVEERSKRLMGYSGYFETYLIPPEQLYLWDICEKKNIYSPGGIPQQESIFDILKKKRAPYRSFTYPLKDKEILQRVRLSLRKKEAGFYFLYLSELDALLHSCCRHKQKVQQALAGYQNDIRCLYETACAGFKEIGLFVFSDHGMAEVKEGVDLKAGVEALGFAVPKDYAAFYDSTMARFWFFNPKAKAAIADFLNKQPCGRILSAEEKQRYGIDFADDMYGEVIFLMNTGTVINPSFMGRRIPEGMHGFDIDDSSMDALLLSNRLPEQKITDVKDFFSLMHTASGKTKVLYFLNSSVRAGAEEHLLRLIKGLDKERFAPLLACPQELLAQIGEEASRYGARCCAVSIRRWRNLRHIFKFLRLLIKEKPAVVHAHQFFASRFAAPLAKLAGVPLTVETSHLREAWRKGIKRAYFIDRFFYRFVDKIIAVSGAVKNYLVKEKKLPPDKISVIHNGINLMDVPFSSNLSPAHQRNQFTFGVVGRLEPQKGHKYFLEAISRLDGRYKGARFVIAGEGSLRGELERQAAALRIAHKVEFFGFRQDIERVFRELDVLVLPSLYEGLPLVLLEAAAFAKPAIATAVDGSAEVVIHQKTGLLIPAQDVLALKKAMEFFLENPLLAKEFGANARKHIENEFDISKQINRTEALYTQDKL